MKVLFVASGNGKLDKATSFVMSQYHSLEEAGIEMSIYSIYGHGFHGYLNNFKALRRQIITFQPDIIHAHYSLCGFLTSFAAVGIRYTRAQQNGTTTRIRPKIFVSILGSYAWGSSFHRFRTRFFIRHIWDGALTKSQRTADELGVKVPVVPNGVNLKQFSVEDRECARKQLQMKPGVRYIMFITNPQRPVKNFPLAEQAFKLVQEKIHYKVDNSNNKVCREIELLVVYNLPHDIIARYMCAGDVVLMTSTSEGSPNVIKEAMACNCPIVSTDVGDVPWLLNGVNGSYVVYDYNAEAIAEALQKAIEFNGRTNGREKIQQLHLTTEQVAQRIIDIYNSIL